jgi:hypothetical protein
VSCIPIHPEHVESRETLWQKYQRLTAQAREQAAAAGDVEPGAASGT